ncbi:MAG: hypothetical protein GKC03_05715 [Methanomassiliicoccales archaeon]|nr:hypothetical protein [Methanomassiliicoccales archaeon]NYT15528.1 hypothetical protein [Methanomassiliicoccales archaeon]
MSGLEETWWKFEHWFKLIGITVGTLLAIEGIICITYLATPNLISGFLLEIMVPFGIHLVIIGIVMVVYWILWGTRLPGSKFTENRWFSLLLLLIGTLLVIESFCLAYYISCHYSYPGHIRNFWIAAAAAQLFVLGMMIVLGWISRNMDEVKTGWARIVAYTFGSIIAAQGLFVMAAAVPLEIENIGVVTAGTISLFGLQLFVLSIIIVIIWGFKDKILFGKKLFSHWLVLDLPILLAEIVAIEGILIIIFAAPINPDILGIEWLGKWVMVALGAQLFFLATICAIAWFWLENGPWESKPVTVIGTLIGALLVTEGMFIMGVAAPIIVDSIGGMLARTVTLAGAQLLIIGAIVLFYWLLKDSTIFKRNITSNRVVSLAPLILGALVTVEGLVLVGYASPVYLEGVGHIRAAWMTLAGIQLFIVGGITCMLWYWRNHSRSEASLTKIGEPIIAWIITAQGLFIMGIAAPITIDGIGGLLERTVAIAGAQLFLLALAIIGLRFLRGRNLLHREVMGIRSSELLTYVIWALITVEGLVIMALAANIYIEGFGGISGIYIALAGVQLSLFALLGMSSWLWRNEDISYRRSQKLALVILFLLLLVPPAFIL